MNRHGKLEADCSGCRSVSISPILNDRQGRSSQLCKGASRERKLLQAAVPAMFKFDAFAAEDGRLSEVPYDECAPTSLSSGRRRAGPTCEAAMTPAELFADSSSATASTAAELLLNTNTPGAVNQREPATE